MAKCIKYGPAHIAVPAERIVFVPYQHPASAALAGARLGKACPQCNALAGRLYSRMPIVAVECQHTDKAREAAAAAASSAEKKSAPPDASAGSSAPSMAPDGGGAASKTGASSGETGAQHSLPDDKATKSMSSANVQPGEECTCVTLPNTPEAAAGDAPGAQMTVLAAPAASASTSTLSADTSRVTEVKSAPLTGATPLPCMPRLPLVEELYCAFFDSNMRYANFTDEALLRGLMQIDDNKINLAKSMHSAGMPLLPAYTSPLVLVLMSSLSLSKGVAQYVITTTAKLFATYGLAIGLIFGYLSQRASALAEHLVFFEEAEQLTTADGVYDEDAEKTFRAEETALQTKLEQSAGWAELQARNKETRNDVEYWSALLELNEKAGLTKLRTERADKRREERAAWRDKNAAAEATLRKLKETQSAAAAADREQKQGRADAIKAAQSAVDAMTAELQQAKTRYLAELQKALAALPEFAYKETEALYAQVKRGLQLQKEYADAVTHLKKKTRELWRSTPTGVARDVLLRCYCFRMLSAQELLLCKLMGINPARLTVLGARYDSALDKNELAVAVADGLGKMLGEAIEAEASETTKAKESGADRRDSWRQCHGAGMQWPIGEIVDARSFNAFFIAPTMEEKDNADGETETPK